MECAAVTQQGQEQDQLKLSFAWTRDAGGLAIKQSYGRDLPLRTISDYLKRWGFASQKPTERAYEQNPKLVVCSGMRWST